ncbi:MAG: MarR family transcriptional regulator [Anaerolineae bacterium]|nr:MarR family transcriptional regulator [Anaerolineae bacterium]MCO5187630.1 MarR family transcriptional regulator [Anaerolineae bacterium]MCO5205012.1 MarR family transcriptional regulator [Anaerolineae bacterium]
MATHYSGTQTEQNALDVYIKLERAAAAVSERINRHLGDHNLTISQFGVLEALYHLGPMHQNQLGSKILKSGGNMTLVIDNLSKHGLVTRERDLNDRRCINVQLTEAGHDLIAAIFPGHVAKVTDEMSVLSADEQRQLGDLLRRLGRQDNDQLIN